MAANPNYYFGWVRVSPETWGATWKVTSAEAAKMRLMGIIAVDRRAVPAWRWVCVRKRLEPSRFWVPPTLDSFEADRRFRRARYRWEMRT